MIKMKDKILFLTGWFPHLQLAKLIKEKHNCDFYTIVDTNKYIKKIFQEQQIVKFEKTWYYRDHILQLNRKPDLNYLSSLEKKYNINFWLTAYVDRIFYQYNNYYKFSDDEILLILEQECRLFEKILDEVNPDFAIISVPDYHHIQILYELCKARGVKILMIALSRLGHRWIISEQPHVLDNYEKIITNYSNHDERTIEELRGLLKGYSIVTDDHKKEYRASMLKKLKAAIRYLLVVCNDEYRQYYVNFGRTRTRILIKESALLLKKLYREFFIKKNFLREINKDDHFVYYPLSFQPESSTLIESPFYNNQLEVISNIARSLPIEYKLYVKEHPVQVMEGWRSISYYKTIIDMPNVRLLHPSVSNDEILENCSLVITITGTLGLEAALYKKPSIVFADVIYSGLPSVYRLKSLEDLPYAIRSSLEKKVDFSDLKKFANCIIDNSVEEDITKADGILFNRFFYGGFFLDVDISTQEALSYLEENKLLYDKISSEFVKKINQHKKHESGMIS